MGKHNFIVCDVPTRPSVALCHLTISYLFILSLSTFCSDPFGFPNLGFGLWW